MADRCINGTAGQTDKEEDEQTDGYMVFIVAWRDGCIPSGSVGGVLGAGTAAQLTGVLVGIGLHLALPVVHTSFTCWW